MVAARELGTVKIGLLGSGTVGGSIQELVFSGALRERTGLDLKLEIVKIYTPHPKEKKWYKRYPELFTTEPSEVTSHPEAEIIAEVLGADRESQLASYKEHILHAFRNGKSVVTSDKAVLARFGPEIWAAATQYNQQLRFEACVGGGIPIIRSLSESFAAEEPQGIFGIINGTCNYILSAMKKEGKSYLEALREAQTRGYAERNPASDTEGIDAEAKLILLMVVSFGLHVQPGTICRKGIGQIQPIDFLYADRKGSCTIKHLASATRTGHMLEAIVSPVLVPYGHFVSNIDGATNAIFFKGNFSNGIPSAGKNEEEKETGSWNYAFIGPGAGGGPTAIAVLGDIFDLARGRGSLLPNPLGKARAVLKGVKPEDQMEACFYLRFVVRDRTGLVGDICQILGKEGINISEVWQLNHAPEELEMLAHCYHIGDNTRDILPFVITLERARLGQVKKALGIVGKQDFNLADPLWLPIWRN